MRNDAEVWVAGVKVSTQTPAIRSGKRIIFLTLDDISGPVDVTLFERWQARCARTVFHSWLLLVSGSGAQARGSVADPRDGSQPTSGSRSWLTRRSTSPSWPSDRKECSLATALGRQRKRQATTGLAPVSAELDARKGGRRPGKLWHSSGGSAGH